MVEHVSKCGKKNATCNVIGLAKSQHVLACQVRQLERTVGLKDLTVAEMEGRLREMSATTFDGVFVWRISDFAKKRQDAIAGRAPAMFSPGNI